MKVLSFPLEKGCVENVIRTPQGSKIVDVECDKNNVIRVYAESDTTSIEMYDEHKIIVIGTGAEIDTANFEMKRIGKVKMANDYVFHVYECLN